MSEKPRPKMFTMSGTKARAFPVRSCPVPVYETKESETVSEGAYKPHNAGVEGSSPSPATLSESAQVEAGQPVLDLARLSSPGAAGDAAPSAAPRLDQTDAGDAWARSTDPATAHEAADAMRGTKADRLAAVVVRALRELGAATSKEVADYTGEELVSVSPRFRPLERRGVIEEAGRKKNPSGSSAILWRLVDRKPMEGAA
jgi:predicted transcriptional regulator